MSQRVLVVGAQGRMGQAAVDAVNQAEGLELVDAVDVGADLSRVLAASRPDVAVDFTIPDAINENLGTYVEAQVRPVVGTTGIRPEVLEAACVRSRELGIGGVVAPNFALGAVLMMELASQAARYLTDIEICEYHHPAKKDAPSGTSLLSREKLFAARGSSEDAEIPIHSIRLGGYLASQEIHLGGPGERLTIRHDSIDRACFMPGVILAVRRVPELAEIVIGLENLLDLS